MDRTAHHQNKQCMSRCDDYRSAATTTASTYGAQTLAPTQLLQSAVGGLLSEHRRRERQQRGGGQLWGCARGDVRQTTTRQPRHGVCIVHAPTHPHTQSSNRTPGSNNDAGGAPRTVAGEGRSRGGIMSEATIEPVLAFHITGNRSAGSVGM